MFVKINEPQFQRPLVLREPISKGPTFRAPLEECQMYNEEQTTFAKTALFLKFYIKNIFNDNATE